MFKLYIFAALFALAAARPGYLASSPAVLSSPHGHYVHSSHYSVPVVRTIVTPIVHTSVVKTVVPVVHTPVVKTVVHAAPVVHASPLYHSAPVVASYAPAYGVWKK
ncbi:larval/pupal cuticle protein H1C-like [Lucilia cuprina]|uniref:larval/pupal cuticle protein H1C-like n=1 Tax=Lucilia cuprina TaxID=7375 RepID=UPI001F06A9DB|nr:larval/pupal cuticle protein H1C-like [Lucilia cuprina]XP_046807733.1 larval/pupal cuticle protein H1C-like [Lucilia cuprina]